ncbi:MAG: phosphorylase [Scytolyngbya sp. HA4215-MV1]|jgi:ATP adenylyltransferase|nr:phosphorylase [Scytolyngbya sp. HA4215-MV1]
MSEFLPPTSSPITLQPGTLWQRILDRTEHALHCGALHSIQTDYEFIEQANVRFLVRISRNVARKIAAKKQEEQKKTLTGKDFNPFLPYEEDLFVADISNTHLCLLNKFNVVDYHLLIITRAFEEQDTWLTLADFEALWACLAEYDGLAFYNGGSLAGASQRHKHLQLIPLPMVPGDLPLPIAPLLMNAIPTVSSTTLATTLAGFPFVNGFTRLDLDLSQSSLSAPMVLYQSYQTLLQQVGLCVRDRALTHQSPGAYNLLVTRAWMLIVPRSQESFESISVNALGFAGSLFARDQDQMQQLKAYGPMNLLLKVAIPG